MAETQAETALVNLLTRLAQSIDLIDLINENGFDTAATDPIGLSEDIDATRWNLSTAIQLIGSVLPQDLVDEARRIARETDVLAPVEADEPMMITVPSVD